MSKPVRASRGVAELLRLVSLSEIAVAWNVSRQTAKRTLDNFGIMPFVLNTARNGSIRYPQAEIDRLLAELRGSKRSLA